MSRESRMSSRREQKFEKHGVEVKEEKSSDVRVVKGKEQTVEFTHAVYARRKLIGRTNTRRHALKLAHQWIRNIK